MKAKRWIALLLTAAMLIAVAAPVFADPEQTKYLCLGDSMSSGMGLTLDGQEIVFDGEQATPHSQYNYGFDMQAIPNAFHSIVADKKNADLTVCARSGIRACDIRYLLDGKYNWLPNDDEFSAIAADVNADKTFTLSDLTLLNEQMGDLKTQIQSADVITLSCGSNDVMVRLVYPLLDLKNYKELPTDLAGWKTLFYKIINTDGLLTKCIVLLIENYSAILKKINELNPDAKVYCLGTYNFGNHFYLDDAKTVDLGSLMQTFANAFNLIIQGLCAKYQNCCFVNILNTETYSATVKEALATDLATLYESQFLYKFHPTRKGQAYIAEQVLKAWQDTDIAVTFDSDVQRVNSVRIDWRDDISADDFNAETHTLTVPYAKQNARVLYAAVTKTNGDKALIAYRLDYKQGGYSAKKLVSVPLPNLGEAFDKALDSLQSTVHKLIK